MSVLFTTPLPQAASQSPRQQASMGSVACQPYEMLKFKSPWRVIASQFETWEREKKFAGGRAHICAHTSANDDSICPEIEKYWVLATFLMLKPSRQT